MGLQTDMKLRVLSSRIVRVERPLRQHVQTGALFVQEDQERASAMYIHIGYINLFQTILFYRTYFDKARLSLIPKLRRPFKRISWKFFSGIYYIAENLSSWKKRNRGNRETCTVKTIQ